MSWAPCEDYPEDRIRQLFGSRESVTPLEICDADHIPANDRAFLLMREEIISKARLHELACQFIESVLPIYEEKFPDDPRPRDAVAAKRAWLLGDIGEYELGVALAAARTANNQAWNTAARGAPWAAAYVAKGTAEWAVTWIEAWKKGWIAKDTGWEEGGTARDAAWAVAGSEARRSATDAAWVIATESKLGARNEARTRPLSLVRQCLILSSQDD